LSGSAYIGKIHAAASRIAEYRNYTPQLACRILLNSRLQEAVKTVPESEFEGKVNEIVEEALLDEFYQQQGQLESVQNEIAVVKDEVKTQRAESRRILAIVIGAVLVIIAIMLEWNKLTLLQFGAAVIGMIAGILAMVGILRSWKIAWNVFLGIAAFASILVAILGFRL